MSLSEQQKEFARQYIIDFNGTKAAIRANYSEKGASVQAARLLANVNISKEVSRLIEERAKRCEIKADDVLNELKYIGFSRMTDFGYWDEETDFTLKPSSELKDDHVAAIEKVEQNTSYRESDGKFGHEVQHQKSTKLKLHSKIKALELLGKHLGIFENEKEPDIRNREANTERIRQAISRTRERFNKRERRRKEKDKE